MGVTFAIARNTGGLLVVDDIHNRELWALEVCDLSYSIYLPLVVRNAC